MSLLFFYALYPFVMIVVYLKNFNRLEELRPKIGSMYEGVRLQSGRTIVLLLLFHFIRRAIYAYTIVFSQQFFVQFISLIFTVQVQTMIICYCNPYDSVHQRRMELFSETMVTLIMYTIYCFTDFIPNPKHRYEIGYVSILLICTHFAVNIYFLVKVSGRQLFFIFKRYVLRIQHNIAL
jgi:hypothetical protein